MFFKNSLFSELRNVVGVFGETKNFLMARNTPSCRRQVGASPALYYIFRGTVVRPGEAGMYEGLVDMCHKICDVVVTSPMAKIKCIFHT